jgi:hypothetical protein
MPCAGRGIALQVNAFAGFGQIARDAHFVALAGRFGVYDRCRGAGIMSLIPENDVRTDPGALAHLAHRPEFDMAIKKENATGIPITIAKVAAGHGMGPAADHCAEIPTTMPHHQK